MLTTPIDVLHQFPVRKSAKQKQAFRDALQVYSGEIGYEMKVEKCRKNCHNILFGDPQKAKYLITAHYDTCAGMFMPNIVTPFNLAAYLLYQMLILVVFFAVAVAVGVLTWLITGNADIAPVAGMAGYWVMLLLMLFGPANPNNANDNTSGVVTVLETMKSLPIEHRDKVCFVLFDLEEAGLVGSAAYRKAHKAATNRQTIINLDCVGDGNEMMMIPTKKLRDDIEKLRPLAKICGYWGQKSLLLHKKGFSFYPSDQKNFPLGVAIGAFRRKKGIGLYYSRIHTKRDTILDQTNVNILRAALVTLICQ